jgi:hypothetical protein
MAEITLPDRARELLEGKERRRPHGAARGRLAAQHGAALIIAVVLSQVFRRGSESIAAPASG